MSQNTLYVHVECSEGYCSFRGAALSFVLSCLYLFIRNRHTYICIYLNFYEYRHTYLNNHKNSHIDYMQDIRCESFCLYITSLLLCWLSLGLLSFWTLIFYIHIYCLLFADFIVLYVKFIGHSSCMSIQSQLIQRLIQGTREKQTLDVCFAEQVISTRFPVFVCVHQNFPSIDFCVIWREKMSQTNIDFCVFYFHGQIMEIKLGHRGKW